MDKFLNTHKLLKLTQESINVNRSVTEKTELVIKKSTHKDKQTSRWFNHKITPNIQKRKKELTPFFS